MGSADPSTPSSRRPLVSVVTPVFNAERFIGETIASLRAQTFNDWEQVLVDDCSSDRTPELIAEQAAVDPRIRIIRHEHNGGVAAARNTAFEHARGRYVAFLDADDQWLPAKLERQVEFMQRGGYAFSYHQYRCIDETGSVITPEPLWMPPSTDYVSYLSWIGTIGNISVMLDREQTGPLHLDPIGAEDFAFFLDLLKRFRAHGLFEDLARYRVWPESLSASKLRVMGWVWGVLRHQEHLEMLPTLRYMSTYLYRGALKNLGHWRGRSA